MGLRPPKWNRHARLTALALLVAVAVTGTLGAHPVPRRAHDRTIIVRLSADPAAGRVVVVVNYRLEVDPFTVVFDDLPALGEKVDLASLRKPEQFYETFTRLYAPILAGNLSTKVDGQAADFTCLKYTYSLRDDDGTPLDHLRCDFVFQTVATPKSDDVHTLTFREGNYEYEEGRIRLSFGAAPSIRVERKTEPSEELKNRAPADLRPGDDRLLRTAEARFRVGGESATAPAVDAAEPSAAPVAEASPGFGGRRNLLELLLDSEQGFPWLILLATAFGAGHALTPGHGKTLVAAYLVGERGTAFDAVLLGLVTTITHTGAVLLLAVLLRFFFPQTVPHDVQLALGLGSGLLIFGLGLWLLLRRLAGSSDHVHVGGVSHTHDAQGRVHLVDPTRVSRFRLVLLGISGGIVPCWDAIVMLLFAVSAQRMWLALPLLVAFSAGLAGVLIAIGLGVVYARGFASSRWGESRLFRALPLANAALVTVMGFWLCYDSVHAPRPTTAAAASSRP